MIITASDALALRKWKLVVVVKEYEIIYQIIKFIQLTRLQLADETSLLSGHKTLSMLSH